MDLHADAIQGFFDIPVDHLTSVGIITDYLRQKHLRDVVVVSPDEGRVKKVRTIAGRLGRRWPSATRSTPSTGFPR